MTLFLVHNDDGKITQANKLYDKPTDDYLDQMNSIGRPFIAVERETLVSPDSWWVNSGDLCEMLPMNVVVSTRAIKAGGSDTVILTGAPADCDFHMDANIPGVGVVVVHSGKLPDGELEIGMDMPCLFTIHLSKFPFKEFAAVIEAHA